MNSTQTAIQYHRPASMIRYSGEQVFAALVEARAAVEALRSLPYQRAWVEELQKLELRREIAGTSRIEGAEFTERELEAALEESPAQLHTRSQRQARAAVQTYRWIASLSQDRPIDAELICEIHRRIVMDADDDHCAPGQLRQGGQNVVFGLPRHRGADGGEECAAVFVMLADSIRTLFRAHDPLIQALAAHYHFAAMHPFLDGNGRTARALEALMLQRAGLRDTCFIAMSNYYHDEKPRYLAALAEVRSSDYDLTPFLVFGLEGIALQSRRMTEQIKHQVSKGLYRNLMFDLFHRLKTPRKRVIAERQIEILKLLLEVESLELEALALRTTPTYQKLKSPRKALIRDLNELIGLTAIRAKRLDGAKYAIEIRLEWPTEITETEFFNKLNQLPKAKTHPFLE
jgi:Fic family protein